MTSPTSGYRQHTNQALVTFATKIGMMALRLVRNVVLARVLGAADRGAFAFLVVLPEMVIAIAGAGLQTSAVRQAADAEDPRALMKTNLAVGIVTGIVFAIGTLAVFQFPALFRGYFDSVAGFAWLVAGVTLIQSMKLMFSQFLTGAGWIGIMNVLRFAESLLLFVIMLAAFAVGFRSLEGAVVSWLLAYIALAGMIAIFFWRRSTARSSFDFGSAKQLVTFGARSHADMVFQKIIGRSDYIFISNMLGSEQLGYYAIAVIGAEILTAIPEAVGAPLTRLLLREGQSDQTHVTLALTRWIMIAVGIAGALGASISEWGIVIVFGEEFAPAAPALVVLVVAVVFASGVSFLRLALIGRNRPGLVSGILGVAAVANLILNWFLIPEYGIVGAAAASASAYLICLILLYGALLFTSPIKWTEIFIPSEAEMKLVRKSLRLLSRRT